MSYAATPKEEREIREAVRVFDEEFRAAMEEQAKGTGPGDGNFIADLYEAIEKDNLDGIREWQEDIAVLMETRECFPEDEQIQARVSYLIDLERQEIERLREEIQDARRRKAEGIRRPGQDNLLF